MAENKKAVNIWVKLLNNTIEAISKLKRELHPIKLYEAIIKVLGTLQAKSLFLSIKLFLEFFQGNSLISRRKNRLFFDKKSNLC
jgi:hypothetical protein